MRRAVAAALALLLGGWLAVRFLVVPRTEAWSVVGADADGAVVWAELSVSNTGLLRDQLTTRFLLLPAGPGSIEHRAQWGPATVTDTGVALAPDALTAVPDGWELRVGGGGLGARLQLRGAKPGCPPEPGTMGGMVEDRVEGRLLTGPAVVTRTRTEGHARHTALYVLGADFAAGIDPLAACPAWVRTGDTTWTGEAADFSLAPTTALTLGAWTLTFRSAGDPIVHDGWAHALAAERFGARAFGFAPPVTEARRAVVRVEGPDGARLLPALVLERR